MTRAAIVGYLRHHINRLLQPTTFVEGISVFHSRPALQFVSGLFKHAQAVLIAVKFQQGDYFDVLGVDIGLGLREGFVR